MKYFIISIIISLFFIIYMTNIPYIYFILKVYIYILYIYITSLSIHLLMDI